MADQKVPTYFRGSVWFLCCRSVHFKCTHFREQITHSHHQKWPAVWKIIDWWAHSTAKFPERHKVTSKSSPSDFIQLGSFSPSAWATIQDRHARFAYNVWIPYSAVQKVECTCVKSHVFKGTAPWGITITIVSLSMQRFWATDGHRKCTVFLFKLSSHHHIYIVQSLFSIVATTSLKI